MMALWHERAIGMNTPPAVDIKRVGSSGQISVGKKLAGRYFREELREDGAIVLVPVAVVPASHWTIRDAGKIKKALAWAAKHPARESDLEGLIARAALAGGRRRGR